MRLGFENNNGVLQVIIVLNAPLNEERPKIIEQIGALRYC